MANRISKSISAPVLEMRSNYAVPEKVFVERQSKNEFEYSFQEPAGKEYINRLLDGYYGATNYLTLYHCLPEIYAPVHEIASRVADAVWQLKLASNDKVIYTDTAFNRLFSRPNPFMDMRQLVYQAVVYRILTGRQFWSKNQPSVLDNSYKSIATWYNLPSNNVYVVQKKADPYTATEVSDIVERYEVTNEFLSQKRVFQAEQVMAMVNFSTRHPYNLNCADNFLEGAEKAIKNLIPVYEARGMIYIKRGALGFIVSMKKDQSGTVNLTPKEKLEIEADHNRTYGVTGDKNPVGITSLPVEFVRTGMSIEELQPFDETLSDAVAIYTCLRVPPHLVPRKDRSTYANADADMKNFYSDVIMPFAREFAECWTVGMGVDKEGRFIWPSFDHINVLQENRKEKADVDKTNGSVWLERWKNGACSLNEWIVANDGIKGTGAIYEKKLFELTPEEAEQVKQIISLSNGKSNAEPEADPNDDKKAKGKKPEKVGSTN